MSRRGSLHPGLEPAQDVAPIQLQILTPTEIFLAVSARKITAQSLDGALTMYPRHISFVTALAPGLFAYEDLDGREVFAAVDEGILVKRDREVWVSTKDAVACGDLGEVKAAVEQRFRQLKRHERQARQVLARLELGFVKQMMELEALDRFR